MTAEELNEHITDIGIERVVADLIARGYYVKVLATEPLLGPDSMVIGTIKLLDAHGFPLAGHSVRVQTQRVPIAVPQEGESSYYVGEATSRRVYELNADGMVGIPFIPGAQVAISIEGAFTRQITVPSTDFDVLAHPSEEDGFLSPAAPITMPIVRT